MPRTRTDVGKLALVPNDEMCLRWSECVAGEYGGGLERSVCPRTAPRSAVHGIRLYETCDVAHGAWHSAQRDRRPVRSQADFDKFSRAARAGKFLIKFSKILTWAKWQRDQDATLQIRRAASSRPRRRASGGAWELTSEKTSDDDSLRQPMHTDKSNVIATEQRMASTGRQNVNDRTSSVRV